MRPPSRKGQPVIVEFSIYVVDVNSINVEDMDFRYKHKLNTGCFGGCKQQVILSKANNEVKFLSKFKLGEKYSVCKHNSCVLPLFSVSKKNLLLNLLFIKHGAKDPKCFNYFISPSKQYKILKAV